MIETEDLKFDPLHHPHSVLIRKKAFSCNYRELALIKTASQKILSEPNNLTYYVIGSEFAGTVEAVGSKITTLRPGDRVIGNASYPESPALNVPPGIPSNHTSNELEVFNEFKLIKIPDSMSYTVGAGFGIGAQTAYAMIEKIGLENGKKILITGINSATSRFILNAVRNMTTEIVALSRSEIDQKYFELLGVKKSFVIKDDREHFLTNSELHNYLKQTGLFDYIFDPFGDKNLLRSIDILALNGKYVTCGVSNQFNKEMIDVPLNLTLSKIIQHNLSISGNCLGSTAHLKRALQDYADEKFSFIEHSVFSENVSEFISQSFVYKKSGKAIFQYI